MTTRTAFDFGRRARPNQLIPGEVIVDERGVRARVVERTRHPAGWWHDTITLTTIDVLAGQADQHPPLWRLAVVALVGEPEPYDPDEGPGVPAWTVVDLDGDTETAWWFEYRVVPVHGGDAGLRRVWLGEAT